MNAESYAYISVKTATMKWKRIQGTTSLQLEKRAHLDSCKLWAKPVRPKLYKHLMHVLLDLPAVSTGASVAT